MEQEIWIDARHHENYEVSNMGQVRRKKTNKILKQQKGSNNYNVVTLWTNRNKKTKYIARLIWQSFNQCDCELTIDHIDRNKDNNKLSNLRCITMEENWYNRTIYKNNNKYNLNDNKKTVIINNLISKKWTTYRASKETGIPVNYLDTVVKRGTWNKFIDERNRVQ